MIRSNPNNRTIKRDIEIVQEYFGLGSQDNPTYESIGEFFGKVSRERVRQIIEKKYRERVSVDETSYKEIKKFEEFINENDFILLDDLISKAASRDFLESDINPYGLKNFLFIFNLCKDYKIYNANFNEASKEDFLKNRGLFLANDLVIEQLKSNFYSIRKLPSKRGIVNLQTVSEKNGLNKSETHFFKEIFSNLNECWIKNHDGEFWYLFEDRENAIFNVLGKVSCLTKEVSPEILSKVIDRYLRKRRNEFGYPPVNIIKNYLMSGKRNKFDGSLSL